LYVYTQHRDTIIKGTTFLNHNEKIVIKFKLIDLLYIYKYKEY
jgi:hypothetical protein